MTSLSSHPESPDNGGHCQYLHTHVSVPGWTRGMDPPGSSEGMMGERGKASGIVAFIAVACMRSVHFARATSSAARCKVARALGTVADNRGRDQVEVQ
jgi:hypothetical protein